MKPSSNLGCTFTLPKGKLVAVCWSLAVAFALGEKLPGVAAAEATGADPEARRQEIVGRATVANPDAARLYERGRQAWGMGTPAALERAEKFFNEAVTIDSKFARAYAGLADVWLLRAANAKEDGKFARAETMPFAAIVAQITRALELEPDLGEAHASLGNAYAGAWRLEEAKTELETAIRLNPGHASAHQWLARLLETEGRLDEAIAAYRRAVAIDPLSVGIADDLARALLLAGRLPEALASADRALALQPDQVQARRWRAWTLMEMNRQPEAIAEARRLASAAGPMDLIYACAVLYRVGLAPEADGVFRQIPASVKTSVHYLLAVAGRRGDDVIALMAPAIGPPAELPLLLYLPAFDPIRGHPRFREIIREAGAGAAHSRAQAERARWRESKAQEAKDEGKRGKGAGAKS